MRVGRGQDDAVVSGESALAVEVLSKLSGILPGGQSWHLTITFPCDGPLRVVSLVMKRRVGLLLASDLVLRLRAQHALVGAE
jgi:hypothetical protein